MKSKQPYVVGILMAVAGIVLFSAKAVLVKMAYIYGIEPINLLVFRMLFSLPFYLFMVLRYGTKKSGKLSRKDYLWLIFFGFIGYYLASYLDFEGLRFIKAGLERIILFTYPTIVLVLASIFFKEKITFPQVVTILLTYIGVVITFWGELDLSQNNVVLGVFLVFLSALTYAIYLIGSGWLIPKLGVKTFTSYAMTIACLFTLFHFGISNTETLLNYPYQIYIIGLIMAVFCTIIPSYLVSAAIERLGAPNFSIIASIGPASTIMFAYILLGETLSLLQFIGGIIIIIGIVYLGVIKNRTKAKIA